MTIHIYKSLCESYLWSGITKMNSVKIFEVLNSYKQLSSRRSESIYTQPRVYECPCHKLQHWSFYSLNFCQFEKEGKKLVLIFISFVASKSKHFSYLLAI